MRPPPSRKLLLARAENIPQPNGHHLCASRRGDLLALPPAKRVRWPMGKLGLGPGFNGATPPRSITATGQAPKQTRPRPADMFPRDRRVRPATITTPAGRSFGPRPTPGSNGAAFSGLPQCLDPEQAGGRPEPCLLHHHPRRPVPGYGRGNPVPRAGGGPLFRRPARRPAQVCRRFAWPLPQSREISASNVLRRCETRTIGCVRFLRRPCPAESGEEPP